MSILAKIEMKHTSGLLEDTCVNTLHFGGSPVGANFLAITQAIDQFYNQVHSGSGRALSEFLSSELSRADLVQVKYYEDKPKPAPGAPSLPNLPVATGAFFLQPPISQGNNLPEEVAVVMSFQGPPLTGVSQASRRGRIYVGPLIIAALTGGGRPTASFIAGLVGAGQRLNDASAVAGGANEWGVYSPTNDTFTPVTNGWVDDAADTQRRRGQSPTLRTTWT